MKFTSGPSTTFCSSTSQIRVLESELLAIRLSSGDIATTHGVAGRRTPQDDLSTNAPFSTSQMRTVLSKLVATRRLSLKNAISGNIVLVGRHDIIGVGSVISSDVANPLTA